ATECISVVFQCCNCRSAYTDIGIEDVIPFFGECKYKPLDQTYWELARMVSFLNVVRFDIGNVPDIRRIFPKRIARKCPFIWPFEMLLVRVFGWHTNWIEIKDIVIGFSKP